jgi:hypothetical protein
MEIRLHSMLDCDKLFHTTEMDIEGFSDALLSGCQITQCHFPADSNLYIDYCAG